MANRSPASPAENREQRWPMLESTGLREVMASRDRPTNVAERDRHLRQTRLLLGGWLEASEYEGDVAQMLSDEATGVLVMVCVVVGGTAVQVLAIGRYEDWQLIATVAAAFAARILWFLWKRRRAAAWLDEHGYVPR